MNTMLTDEQLEYIQQQLEQMGLHYLPLLNELTDHVCCAVEKEMDKGLSFEEAYTQVMQNLHTNEMLSIQQQTALMVSRKFGLTRRVAVFSTSVAASLLLFVIVSNAKERSNIDPVRYTPASIYNQQIQVECQNKQLHTGYDYLVPEGTPVVATGTGRVITIKNDREGFGKYIIISHEGKYETLYAHLSAQVVYAGQQVEKGEVIGYSGKSGAAREPHLHYQLQKRISY